MKNLHCVRWEGLKDKLEHNLSTSYRKHSILPTMNFFPNSGFDIRKNFTFPYTNHKRNTKVCTTTVHINNSQIRFEKIPTILDNIRTEIHRKLLKIDQLARFMSIYIENLFNMMEFKERSFKEKKAIIRKK